MGGKLPPPERIDSNVLAPMWEILLILKLYISLIGYGNYFLISSIYPRRIDPQLAISGVKSSGVHFSSSSLSSDCVKRLRMTHGRSSSPASCSGCATPLEPDAVCLACAFDSALMKVDLPAFESPSKPTSAISFSRSQISRSMLDFELGVGQ